MITKKTIDMLTKDSVSILTERFIEDDGTTYKVGENHRCAYVNSTIGRENILVNEPEDVSSAVLAYWGDEPTIIEEATNITTYENEEL